MAEAAGLPTRPRGTKSRPAKTSFSVVAFSLCMCRACAVAWTRGNVIRKTAITTRLSHICHLGKTSVANFSGNCLAVSPLRGIGVLLRNDVLRFRVSIGAVSLCPSRPQPIWASWRKRCALFLNIDPGR
jgi:hypothetical protein